MTDGLAYPLVRGLILAALLLLIGTVAAGILRRRFGPPPDDEASRVIDGWLHRLPGLLAWFVLVLSMLRGALQVLSFLDPGEPVDPDLAKAVLSTGAWGTGWIIQTSGAFILLALSWLVRNDPRRLAWTVGSFTLLLIFAQSGMGHGADAHWQPGALGRLIHSGHLLGAGLWLGTLAILALAVFPSLVRARDAEILSRVVTGYSSFAKAGVGLLVISGLTATWRYSDRLVELPQTQWGLLLVIKLGCFLIAGGIGLWNWQRVTPRLTSDSASAPALLRRAVMVEVVVGGVILALTAVLAATALPIDLID